MTRLNRLVLLIIAAAIGCTSNSTTSPVRVQEEHGLTARLAKQAILDRIQTGRLPGFDHATYAKVEIREAEDGWHDFGEIRMNLKEKRYTFSRGPGPEVRACTFSFEGSFGQDQGKWVALEPRETGSSLVGAP